MFHSKLTAQDSFLFEPIEGSQLDHWPSFCSEAHRLAENSMIIPIDQVEPGMMLGRNITDHSGDILLIKGTQLTAQHLNALNRRGIEAVAIVDPASEGTVLKSNPELLSTVEVLVSRRLQQVPIISAGLRVLRELAVRRAFAHRSA